MITVHHLGISQSERIVWLLEDLGLEYKLVIHTRDPLLAPESLTSIRGNDTGKAPFIEDSDAGISLSESGAICEYITQRYGHGKFTLQPSDKPYPGYLYWLHYANGTLFPTFVTEMFLDHAEGVADNAMIKQFSRSRIEAALKHVDERLRADMWLAGEDFTIADMMTVYAATTQRYWGPQVSLEGYNNLLRWLKDCAGRPAYQQAMQKGDPEKKVLKRGGGSKGEHDGSWRDAEQPLEEVIVALALHVRNIGLCKQDRPYGSPLYGPSDCQYVEENAENNPRRTLNEDH